MNFTKIIISTSVGFSLLWSIGSVHAQGEFAGDGVYFNDEETGEDVIAEGITRNHPTNSPYEIWFKENKSKMPHFEGLVIQDARTEPLEYWEDMGVNGLYVKMADYQLTDGRILEIPAKGEMKSQRHMFEAGIYFFGGPGHIIIQQEGKRPQRIDYNYRSLYSVPPNVRYQIFNDSDKPVRLVVVTSLPFIMNSTNSEKFMFDNDFAFDDRYNAEEDYLKKSDQYIPNRTVTNFVTDALEYELDEYDRRGKGGTNMHWTMSGNTMIDMHVSEMTAAMYKRAHRHSSDAFILVLSGEGYSVTWPGGDNYEDRERVDWQEGTIFVPPIMWYHQHLNPHPTKSARYLAINAPRLVSNLGLRFDHQLDEDQDPPGVKLEFEAELAKYRDK